MAQPQPGTPPRPEADEGAPGEWNDPEVFGELSTSSPAASMSSPTTSAASATSRAALAPAAPALVAAAPAPSAVPLLTEPRAATLPAEAAPATLPAEAAPATLPAETAPARLLAETAPAALLVEPASAGLAAPLEASQGAPESGPLPVEPTSALVPLPVEPTSAPWPAGVLPLSPSTPSIRAAALSEAPETFRPVARTKAPGPFDDDDLPIDTSRFIKRSNPWARLGVGVGVATALGLLGFAVSRGPGHSAAEEVVLASGGSHQEAREALLRASMSIGKACGDGKASSTARVRATFMPEGNVLSATVLGAHADTPVGECVVAKVRQLRSQPFNGLPVTVTEEVSLRASD